MKKNLRIRLCSDLDYGEMVADICYENNTVATTIQEKGINNMEIKIFPPPEGKPAWNLSLAQFQKMLEEAKNHLLSKDNMSNLHAINKG